MHCFMSIVFVLMKLISMELTLRRITSAKCIVENRNKLPEATWEGDVLAVQMFFIALAQDDILVIDSHIEMFDLSMYFTCTNQNVVNNIVKELVAHINILFLNDVLQFYECHHLYFPLPERAELERERARAREQQLTKFHTHKLYYHFTN